MEWMLDRQYTPPELVQNRVEREAKRRRRLAEEEQAKQARSMASGPSFQAVISQPPLQGLSLPPPPRLSGLLRGPAQQRRNEAPADTSVNEPARVSGKLPANPKRRRPIIHVDDASGEELPDPKTFITKRRPSPATPVRRPPSPPRSPSNQSTPPQPSPSDIRGREWTVARILNRREEPQQEGTAYLAEWSDSIIQERDIWTRADGTKVVRCDSADWPVYDAVPEPRHGPHARKVRWRQTWRAAHDLQGVEEMIQEYNNEHRQPTRGDHGDAGVDSGSPGDCLAVPDAEALPSREPSSPQVDDSREMNSSGDKLPVAPTIPGHRFHPKPGVDYRSAVHRFLAATAKAETKIFLQRLNAPAALPLLFAAWQCNLGGAVDIFRYSHATLVSISGFEQPQPCEGCVNGTGPFAKCVVGEGQFSHGSCTNCAYRGVSKKCCFHEQAPKPRVPIKVRLPEIRHRSSQRLPGSSPCSSQSWNPPSGSAQRSSREAECAGEGQSHDTQRTSPPPAIPSLDISATFSPRAISLVRDKRGYRHKRKADEDLFMMSGALPNPDEEEEPAHAAQDVDLPSFDLDGAATSSEHRRKKRKSIDGSDQKEKRRKGKCSHDRQKEDEPTDKSKKEKKREKKREKRGKKQQRKKDRKHKHTSAPKLVCDSRPSSRLDLIHNTRTFARKEATDAEVDYILSCCPPSHRLYLTRGFQLWQEDPKNAHRLDAYTCERWLSRNLVRALNWAVRDFCPAPALSSLPRSGNGRSMEEAICLDD